LRRITVNTFLPIFLGIAVLSGIGIQAAKKPYVLPKNVIVHRDIEYARVSERSLKLDLYLPQERKSDSILIVWLHGGGWRKGSKNKTMLDWLPQHGYAVASIDFRLSTEARFPALIHDTKGAIRWLRAHAEDYKLSVKKIGVAGSSSGGHMAALIGTTGDVETLEGRCPCSHPSRNQG